MTFVDYIVLQSRFVAMKTPSYTYIYVKKLLHWYDDMQIQKYEAVLEETMLAVILDDHSWRAAFKTTYRTNVSYEEKQQI